MHLHHVQVSIPAGGEVAARRFYGDGLGLTEVAKPAALAGRGGCWFRRTTAQGQVLAEIHLGVEEPFVPAAKAHPALVVEGQAEWEALAARLEAHGGTVSWAERDTFPGYLRFHATDPFGNRVELLTPTEAGAAT
ncbi:VOC family protein [Galactobacter caseinivorans]|uniref:Glyoxalase n=1 Tax=Galactobacter caseinivorans TaxID=2676123 RepID=A0A496PL33_9MICC|nr:VOC family protein [Galactobacter caseinivorans]RKW71224.1 glyoxalase [Galactobacter caseinivorans]